tara:strand:+ start:1251 stop:1652 length:402 start_codon:yes stop_codon:yes gene_type:complete
MGYNVNDKVVFRTQGTNQIGVITNKKKSDNKIYYDIRSEAGSGYVLVPIDKARNKGSKNYAIIDSNLTKIWNESVANEESEPTNLFAKEGFGHTRANYPKGTVLNFDGDNQGKMGQMEKKNDFIFPTQGPRSF